MERLYLVNNKVEINGVEYEKTKEFTYDGKEYIEVCNNSIWKKMLLEKVNGIEYCTIDDEELLYKLIKEFYPQSLDVTF